MWYNAEKSSLPYGFPSVVVGKGRQVLVFGDRKLLSSPALLIMGKDRFSFD